MSFGTSSNEQGRLFTTLESNLTAERTELGNLRTDKSFTSIDAVKIVHRYDSQQVVQLKYSPFNANGATDEEENDEEHFAGPKLVQEKKEETPVESSQTLRELRTGDEIAFSEGTIFDEIVIERISKLDSELELLVGFRPIISDKLPKYTELLRYSLARPNGGKAITGALLNNIRTVCLPKAGQTATDFLQTMSLLGSDMPGVTEEAFPSGMIFGEIRKCHVVVLPLKGTLRDGQIVVSVRYRSPLLEHSYDR